MGKNPHPASEAQKQIVSQSEIRLMRKAVGRTRRKANYEYDNQKSVPGGIRCGDSRQKRTTMVW